MAIKSARRAICPGQRVLFGGLSLLGLFKIIDEFWQAATKFALFHQISVWLVFLHWLDFASSHR